VALSIALSAAVLSCAPAHAGLEQFNLSNPQIDLGRLLSGGPGKDGIPAISRPKFVSAGRADFVQPGELVVGVALGGEARAYPIAILNWHEIVNDRIADVPVAVTWCPLTRISHHSGI